MVGWIDLESLRIACPDFADVFERREPLQCLQLACIIVGRDEVREMCFKLIVVVAVVAFHGHLFS